MKEFGNTLQQIKSVLNDTAFAVEVVKPVPAKDSATTKKTVISKKQIASKQNNTQVKKNDKQSAEKKQPKAVMKKQR